MGAIVLTDGDPAAGAGMDAGEQTGAYPATAADILHRLVRSSSAP